MPNLQILPSSISWSRVCPRAINLQFVISKSDGNCLGYFAGSPSPDRDAEVRWWITGPSYKGLFVIPAWSVYAQSQLLVQATLNEMPPGEYEIHASLDVLMNNLEPPPDHLGPCGVGDAQVDLDISNGPPVLSQSANITVVSSDSVTVTVNGYITDECPGFCNTVVTGSIVGVDDNMLETTSVYPLGSRSSNGMSSYSQDWVVSNAMLNQPPVAGDTTGVKLMFRGITTDQFGAVGYPANSAVCIRFPANRRFGENE